MRAKFTALLRSLLSEFDNLSDTFIYGKDTLSLEEVQVAFSMKELKKMCKGRRDQVGKGLYIEGMSQKRHSKIKKGSRSKSRDGNKRMCFICGSEDHIKKECPEYKKKKKSREQKNQSGDADVVSEGYESVEVMCVSVEKTHHEWVLDFGCSFHICPNKDWFVSYTKNHGGQVLLGNNKACKVVRISSIKMKLVYRVTRISCKG